MVLEREIKAKAVVRFWRREEKREESVLLPKPERLSKASEIKATLKTRQYFSSTPLLSLVARDNARACSRLVVVTPKKLGNACKRNRIRRVICAAYCEIRHKIAKNIDLVVFPERPADDPSLAKSRKELHNCLIRAKLLCNA
ncbi:ribonuclease P protein component [candidate division WOR-1 bacterium RIFCSPLOWO2_02_FULL_46_20]|uniref:Ribonuclease P protein component n=2 Tax=Saganbacteria TaxID=1703751 RepID=A0A1F4RFP4_UNCSA|nr:MAG: ribonuclease P protein component [candidate division WOR-1 bacterium RIFCSPHIGHO2_02_FULL_45_12]OGC06990.1 MAG: ribonuclease P protein component [candidate division WOR-1 bacterium RIFCSPLOWO2_02_FULL_46_20]OGC09491.1 MAG: ribonuclease P protein component [candidate division WOR-1 bacterium RIFCSPLOWO2_12_FULL_45_9]